jgi:hypothetical protein
VGIVTLAPEIDGARARRRLAQLGVRVSLGHPGARSMRARRRSLKARVTRPICSMHAGDDTSGTRCRRSRAGQ